MLYEVNPEAGFVLAVDVGREFVRGALADLAGTVRSRGRRSVHAARSHGRVSELIGLAAELAEAGRGGPERHHRRRRGQPGVYDPGRDALTLAGGLPGWGHSTVVADLRGAFGPNMVLENDINLAALAERDHGHGREVDTFAFVSVGTGYRYGPGTGRPLAQGRPWRRRRDRLPSSGGGGAGRRLRRPPAGHFGSGSVGRGSGEGGRAGTG